MEVEGSLCAVTQEVLREAASTESSAARAATCIVWGGQAHQAADLVHICSEVQVTEEHSSGHRVKVLGLRRHPPEDSPHLLTSSPLLH